MKILITSRHFYPENFRINSVAKGLVALGYEVDVLTGMPNYPSGKIFKWYVDTSLKDESYEGISILRVPIFLRGGGSNIALSLNYLSFVLSTSIFGYWRLKKRYYTVVCYVTSPIIQAILAIILVKKNHAKIVLNVQDLWSESVSATGRIHSPVVIWALSKIVSWIYKCSDIVLVHSEAFRESILQIRSSLKTVYWLNSVDPRFYKGEEVDLPSSLVEFFTPDKFIITFAGNIGSVQSIQTVVEAAKLLKDHSYIKTVLLEDGSRRAWALQGIKDRNLSNFYLSGAFPESLMPSIYQKSSFLLVSLANKNIFSLTIPNKIQGYLAQGRPVIGSLNGIGAKVIENARVSLTASAENPQLLAQKNLEMSKKSINELETYARNGKAYFINHFERDRRMGRLDGILTGFL